MKKIIIMLCIIISFNNPIHSQIKNEKQSITNAEKIFCLSKFWSDVKYNFVYFDKLKFDIDSLYYSSLEYILNTKEDNKEIYLKPVIILTDERTISSAEDFCVGFRCMKRGKIIGGKVVH